MRMHIAEGALRVKVLDRAADGRESTAMETAWHCDLVITTFQRLSVEWSNGRIKPKSIFNQVSNCVQHALCILLPQVSAALHIEHSELKAQRCNDVRQVTINDRTKTWFVCSLHDTSIHS